MSESTAAIIWYSGHKIILIANKWEDTICSEIIMAILSKIS